MDCKLQKRNSSSDGNGEERWPRNRSIQSLNPSLLFSSHRLTKPGKYIPRFKRTVCGTSKSDQTSDTDRVPVVDNVESEEDEEWMIRDDEYDSDDLSLESAKKSKWLRDFFKWFDSSSIDEINDPMMKHHCPVCKNGVGGIALFKGLQGVLTHAETVRSRRVRLHQRFSEILRGELRDRNSHFSVVSEEGESSEWMGLGEETDDHLIVWPPMVIVQNTRSHWDVTTGKWIGVGNSDLRNCFKNFDIRKVENAYGPGGHCGISLLIFDGSAKGYLEAERLDKQYLSEGRGKYKWQNNKYRTRSTEKGVLYAYMALEEDVKLFNKHSKGKQKHKYEMKSYKDMVVDPLKSMENKVIGLETQVSSSMEENKKLTQTCDVYNQKLHLRSTEIERIRSMANTQSEETKNQIEFMEKHFEEIIKQLTQELEETKKLQEPTIPLL